MNCLRVKRFVKNRIYFTVGASPQVTKNTKVVLPFRLTQRDFTRAPQNWDVRLHQQDGFVLTLQVTLPTMTKNYSAKYIIIRHCNRNSFTIREWNK